METRVFIGIRWGYIGLHSHNGKENASYYLGVRVQGLSYFSA